MKRLFLAVMLVVVCRLAFAQNFVELGRRVALESSGLILFAEIGNIGAGDPECRNVPFPISDIDSLIATDVLPTMVMGATAAGEKFDNSKKADVVNALREIPQRKEGGIIVARKTYGDMKANARTQYGASSACASLSTAINTIIHQKRAALKNMRSSFEAKK